MRVRVSRNYELHDPVLSTLGIEQCAALRQSLRDRFERIVSDIGLQDVAIIASPMRRTLQTAHLALDWLIDQGKDVTADAGWQENSHKNCDVGTQLDILRLEFPSVDFRYLDPIFPDKTSPAAGRYAHTKSAILARGKTCLEELSKRPEKLIFVVSHSGFLRCGVTGWWFFNADYRIFDFDAGWGEPIIKQDGDTVTGGLGWSWPDPVALGSDLPDDTTE